jgi:hypothetical protein
VSKISNAYRRWGVKLADKGLPPQFADILKSMEDRYGPSGPTPAEGLRLFRAFFIIKNVSKRRTLIKLAEKMAADEDHAQAE